jgi:hypothetical protein
VGVTLVIAIAGGLITGMWHHWHISISQTEAFLVNIKERYQDRKKEYLYMIELFSMPSNSCPASRVSFNKQLKSWSYVMQSYQYILLLIYVILFTSWCYTIEVLVCYISCPAYPPKFQHLNYIISYKGTNYNVPYYIQDIQTKEEHLWHMILV